ncbi:hypothetical protein QQ045_012825 [Rhodiola kirilowii]
MEDWRPISLCTVAMKVITKAIATRLQPYLDEVISPAQAAFIQVLNAKLRAAIETKLISGIKICRGAPIVTHLFFADDSIFFLKADSAEAGYLRQIFSQYEKASGQKINFKKSKIYFSRNTPVDRRIQVCNILGIRQVPSHSKYLGLPLILGQQKTDVFKCIIEKIWRKISYWKIIQALPVYMMSVYYFPHRVLDEIAKMISQFWWNKKEGAILLKIAWRMVRNPQMLVSRILAAKYCHN